jgi:type I restriction-modification system DNA methylase subunit
METEKRRNSILSKFTSPIKEIIERLGYADSSNLIYCNDLNNLAIFPTHTAKILQEISPYAAYVIDSKPFVLFFESDPNDQVFKKISKQIWNAQIPVSIFCDASSIQVFNGSSLDMSTLLIKKVHEESLDDCNEFTPFSYWKISNSNFWSGYVKQYSGVKLTQTLLANIKYLNDQLKKIYKVPFATKLVLRIIFVRYLIDRGVDLDYANFSSDIEKSKSELLRLLSDKRSIYALFGHLKEKFNGNLFDLGQELDAPCLTDAVVTLLANFLSGKEDLLNGQMSLFELYDFNIIPVELISNIYEILLGKNAQSKASAFYTPNYLVEYILDATIAPYLQKNALCTVLDPACGSGVFLVNSYRRMVEKNLNNVLYSNNDSMLIEVLKNNIYGIDIEEEAIDVTIFSLYLTVLDYKDPKTLGQFKLPDLKGTNLYVSDFFDDRKLGALQKIQFDFIIGNPPWGNVKTGLHMQYCNERGHKKRQQNAEISRSFVFRAQDFSNSDTQCCFILPSKLLYNQKQPAQNFRQYLLLNTMITKMIEMSSVRKLVFENADAPAVIVVFQYTSNDCRQNRLTYISLKPNIFFKLFNIIVVEKYDVKFIGQKLLLQNDWAWKTIVFGLNGDLDIILRLKTQYPAINNALAKLIPNLVTGAGVQDHAGDKKDSQYLMGMPMLDSEKGVDHFYVNSSNTTVFTKSEIHRPRDRRLFQPPYCLTAKGLDCSNYTMRSAYSEDRFICKETIYVIKGELSQKSFLLNLVGLFNSTLFAYFNFMLGSSVGIEREQWFMEEVLQFPYVFNKAIAEKTGQIQSLKGHFTLENVELIEAEIESLNSLIINEYGLSDNPFVDYALNIQIPQLTGSSDADIYRSVNTDDMLVYSKYFDDYFSMVYEKTAKYISIILYPDVAKNYAVFELLVNDTPPLEKIKVSEIVDDNKILLARFSVFKVNDFFYQIRDIAYFEESSFFIIKSNYYKNWHPAIAQLDLSEIIDQILSREGGDQ